MLDLTFGYVNPEMPKVFTDVFGYFDTIIPNHFLDQPICKLVARSIENADLRGDGTFVNLDSNLSLYTSFLSGGTKQLLTVLYAGNDSQIPPYLGCYFGDNCWHWVWLFSHLTEFSQSPLRIFIDSDIVHYDSQIKIYAKTDQGYLTSPAQVRDKYIGDVVLEGGKWNFSQNNSEGSIDDPPYFSEFRKYCATPNQLCSISDLNDLASEILKDLENQEGKTNLFSQ